MFEANRHGLARHSDSARLSSGLIGSSPKFMAIFEEVRTVAPVDCAVLIRCETGTGKELVARAIDTQSERRAASFVKLTCAAITAELAERTLWERKGSVHQSCNPDVGSLRGGESRMVFLDEIGDIPSICRPNYSGLGFDREQDLNHREDRIQSKRRGI